MSITILERKPANPLSRLALLLAVSAGAALAAGCPTVDRQPDAAPPETESAGVVFTADEDANSVTRVDLATGETRQVSLAIRPHNVQISADGGLLLLVGPLTAAPGGDHAHNGVGRLVVLDPATLEELRPAIAAGDHPAHVVIDDANRFAYVTDSGANAVLVVDLEVGQVVHEIPTCAYPHGLRVSPDGGELYVACVEGDEVGVIDVGARAEVARIPVGAAPVQVAFAPDGQHVVVTLRDDDAAAVIDTDTRAVARTTTVGRGPIQVVVAPDGRHAYVANEGTRAQPDSTVSVIELPVAEVVGTVTTGSGAHGVVVTDDGEFVLVSNLFAGTVSVIESASLRVVTEFPVGAGPAGITYAPAAP
jgi:YVTN family beta-propeller protein